MYQYSGKCRCGSVLITFSSPQQINSYTSRKCDCDYCMQRDIEYLSAPQGQISFISKTPLRHEKQGSGQATFLLCSNCQTVVGVCSMNKNMCVGSLNIKLFEEFVCLQASVNVSPKRLSKTEKLTRWNAMWSSVQIIIG
jgi:hypothetical protein